MKQLTTLIVVLLAAVARTEAHSGWEVEIPEFPSTHLPDVQDGSLDDWAVLDGGKPLTRDDFESIYSGGGSFAGYEEDLEITVRLGWSHASQRIYVSCERYDDVYVNTYAAAPSDSIWRHDGLDFWIDGDHSGGRFDFHRPREPAGWDTLSNFHAQSYAVVSGDPSGGFIEYSGRRVWVEEAPLAGVGGLTHTGYPIRVITEFYVTPFDQIDVSAPGSGTRSVLQPGAIIGFQVAVREFDGVPGDFKDYWTIDRQTGVYKDANRFVDGVLVPCSLPGCSQSSGTSTDRDSWGRIKASLR